MSDPIYKVNPAGEGSTAGKVVDTLVEVPLTAVASVTTGPFNRLRESMHQTFGDSGLSGGERIVSAALTLPNTVRGLADPTIDHVQRTRARFISDSPAEGGQPGNGEPINGQVQADQLLRYHAQLEQAQRALEDCKRKEQGGGGRGNGGGQRRGGGGGQARPQQHRIGNRDAINAGSGSIREGDNNPAVITPIENRINELWKKFQPNSTLQINPDGKWDAADKATLMEMQKALVPYGYVRRLDGIFGQNTLQSLERAANAGAPGVAGRDPGGVPPVAAANCPPAAAQTNNNTNTNSPVQTNHQEVNIVPPAVDLGDGKKMVLKPNGKPNYIINPDGTVERPRVRKPGEEPAPIVTPHPELARKPAGTECPLPEVIAQDPRILPFCQKDSRGEQCVTFIKPDPNKADGSIWDLKNNRLIGEYKSGVLTLADGVAGKDAGAAKLSGEGTVAAVDAGKPRAADDDGKLTGWQKMTSQAKGFVLEVPRVVSNVASFFWNNPEDAIPTAAVAGGALAAVGFGVSVATGVAFLPATLGVAATIGVGTAAYRWWNARSAYKAGTATTDAEAKVFQEDMGGAAASAVLSVLPFAGGAVSRVATATGGGLTTAGAQLTTTGAATTQAAATAAAATAAAPVAGTGGATAANIAAAWNAANAAQAGTGTAAAAQAAANAAGLGATAATTAQAGAGAATTAATMSPAMANAAQTVGGGVSSIGSWLTRTGARWAGGFGTRAKVGALIGPASTVSPEGTPDA